MAAHLSSLPFVSIRLLRRVVVPSLERQSKSRTSPLLVTRAPILYTGGGYTSEPRASPELPSFGPRSRPSQPPDSTPNIVFQADTEQRLTLSHPLTQAQLVLSLQSRQLTSFLQYCGISQRGGLGLHLLPYRMSFGRNVASCPGEQPEDP